MAIIQAFKKWRLELEKSTSLIKVILNYKNLKYFTKSK